jgi:hypothetical protein
MHRKGQQQPYRGAKKHHTYYQPQQQHIVYHSQPPLPSYPPEDVCYEECHHHTNTIIWSPPPPPPPPPPPQEPMVSLTVGQYLAHIEQIKKKAIEEEQLKQQYLLAEYHRNQQQQLIQLHAQQLYQQQMQQQYELQKMYSYINSIAPQQQSVLYDTGTFTPDGSPIYYYSPGEGMQNVQPILASKYFAAQAAQPAALEPAAPSPATPSPEPKEDTTPQQLLAALKALLTEEHIRELDAAGIMCPRVTPERIQEMILANYSPEMISSFLATQATDSRLHQAVLEACRAITTAYRKHNQKGS